jgi:hypothetical protein
MPESPQRRWKNALILLFVWLLCAIYIGMNLKRGWVPHDEGTLGQTAERVLQGEIPHRDFNDPYTGGLSYLDALVFRLFGINLIWLRYALFVFFLLWIPAVFAIAREFCGPWSAAGVTLLAAAWSIPVYSAAMPSWFCLFFATFGILAVLRYIRQPRPYWLVLAGLSGGFSFLIKSIGLYYVAGVLLFFVYREQLIARDPESRVQESRPQRNPVYFSFVVLCLVLFLVVLLQLVIGSVGSPELFHFVLPGFALVLLLAIRERDSANIGNWPRFRELSLMAAPFLAGVALPVLIFFAMYWHFGAFHRLMLGLFVLPFRRVLDAQSPPPKLGREIPAILAVFVTVLIAVLRGKWRLILSRLAILVMVILLFTSRLWKLSYLLVLYSARGLVPVLAAAAVIALYLRGKRAEKARVLDQRLMLLLSVTVLCSLVQYPFAAPIYFFYVAPLVVLCVAGFLSLIENPPRTSLWVIGACYLLFAVFAVRPTFIYDIGHGYQPDRETVPLALQRAPGLRVSQRDVIRYGELIPFVSHLAAGQPILAGPDCPEVYFLSGLKNPTPVLFDFLQDPNDYEREMERLLDRPQFIRVVVVSDHPYFSHYQLEILRSLVTNRFPESRQFDSFEVFWRP